MSHFSTNNSPSDPMREELTETKRWRASIQKYSQRSQGWASQRWAQRAELDAKAVDAALADETVLGEAAVVQETVTAKPNAADIISSLASQLDLLEKQRVQLQMLLKQAQTND